MGKERVRRRKLSTPPELQIMNGNRRIAGPSPLGTTLTQALE
jgi:hypothetical protein